MIKKYFTFLLVLTLIFVGFSSLRADEPTEQKNAVVVNPVGLLFGVFNAGYIMKLNDKTSLEIFGEYWTWKSGDFKASALGIGGAYLFHFKPTALRGWYAGPTASILFWKAENTYFDYSSYKVKTEEATSTWFSIGGIIGYRWVFNSGLLIDLNTGIQYMIGELEIGGTKLGLSGFGWGGIGAGIGYAF